MDNHGYITAMVLNWIEKNLLIQFIKNKSKNHVSLNRIDYKKIPTSVQLGIKLSFTTPMIELLLFKKKN